MTEEDKALVERLRGDLPDKKVESHWITDYTAVEMQNREAADRIEALSAKNERLREILRDCDPESMSWLDARDAALGETE